MSDQLATGRHFRTLNIVDDFSRECVGHFVDVSILGARLARYLEELSMMRGLSKTLVYHKRAGADREGSVLLVAAGGRRAPLHPAWCADPERFHREFQQKVT